MPTAECAAIIKLLNPRINDRTSNESTSRMKTEHSNTQRLNTPEAQDHSEGCLARTLEQQTAKLPSDVWLWGALGSMGLSLAYRLSGARDQSLFIGQWAAPLLLIGVYNKIVKVGGSDRVDH
jgi:hypothetical protein